MIRIEFWNGQTSNKPKYMPFDGLVIHVCGRMKKNLTNLGEKYIETNADSTKNQWAIRVEEDQAIFYWK